MKNPNCVDCSSRAMRPVAGEKMCGPDDPARTFLKRAAMLFDSEAPEFSGSMAGESFAATVEAHPRYPTLCRGRCLALFGRLDDIVANHLDSIAGNLYGLGFDDAGVVVYRAAALAAFRAAILPIQ
jgi:hypothetical protein